jgi:hypothetical protein
MDIRHVEFEGGIRAASRLSEYRAGKNGNYCGD